MTAKKAMRAKITPVDTELALQFAQIVSVAEEDSIIYRSGQHSLFNTFANCCRRPGQNDGRKGRRDTLNEMRFNKVLEKDEFTKMRYREHDDQNNQECVGSYVFINRRWRDPTDPADSAAMIVKYKELVARHEGGRYSLVPEEILFHNICMARADVQQRRRIQNARKINASNCSQSHKTSVSSARSERSSSVHSAHSVSGSSLASSCPARSGNKRKSPEQEEFQGDLSARQAPSTFHNFLGADQAPSSFHNHFLPHYTDLENVPSPPSSLDSNVGNNICEVEPVPSMLAARDGSAQEYLMSNWVEWEDAELAKQTAAILEQEPFEVVNNAQFHEDFYSDLFLTDSVGSVAETQDTDTAQREQMQAVEADELADELAALAAFASEWDCEGMW
eukprot:415757-Rhodomonas_salina.1